MRMCPGSTAGRQWVRIPLCPPSGIRDPGSDPLLSFLFVSDCRERPARRLKSPAVIRRNWVGPGSYLGPEDGSIPSCATRLQKASIYLDSRQRPARRTPDCPAVIRSIGTGPHAGSIPGCSSRASPVSSEITVHVLLCGSINDMVCRPLPGAVIRSICVVVAQQPSKLLGPVRVRYAAPAGRIRPFLAIRIPLTETSISS